MQLLIRLRVRGGGVLGCGDTWTPWGLNGQKEIAQNGAVTDLQVKLITYQNAFKVSAYTKDGKWLSGTPSLGKSVVMGTPDTSASLINSISAVTAIDSNESSIDYSASYLNTGLKAEDKPDLGEVKEVHFDYERAIKGKYKSDEVCNFHTGFLLGHGFVPLDKEKGLMVFSTKNAYNGYGYTTHIDVGHSMKVDPSILCLESITNNWNPSETVEFTPIKDINSRQTLGNLALNPSDNLRSGIDPDSLMTQVAFKLDGSVFS
jgi:hypothetical protein